jgi:hypothetical protein
MASINNVITVALLAEGQAAAADNMNVTAIISGKQGVLSSAERFRLYKDASAVALDYGASSEESSFANTFFASSPNPVSAGGVLVMGYWRAADEVVPDLAATLLSEQSTAAALVPIINAITDGSFTITVDGGTEIDATGIDGTTVSTLDDIVALLNTAITGATVSQLNGYFKITSDSTGTGSTLTFLGTSATGTDISTVLGLSTVTGAVLTQGVASVTLSAETKLAGITAIKAAVNIKGAMFIDNILDADVPGLATFAVANAMLIYEVFTGSSYLVKSSSNPVWAVKLASQSNFRCLFSAAGNRKLAASYMARNHTVLFTGQNTAITMNLKALSVAAESYTETVIASAYTVGLDLLTTIKDVVVVLTSPANDFVDNIYNLLAFIDNVQTNSFNLLKVTPTKIPQTEPGIDAIEDDVEKTCRQFVRAGVFAPGTWTLSDFFGDLEQFTDAIKSDGFYVLAGSLADQSTADRQNRLSPVIQVAVKNAGAVHKENIIISFNK